MDTKRTQKLPSHQPLMKTIETSSTFPDDIVEEILSRLSVRRLLRFRCVSKSWFALIDCPRFIKKQHEKQYAIFKEEGDVPLFFYARHGALNFGDLNEFYLLSKRSGDVPLCVTSDLERDVSHYSPMDLELLRTLRLVGFVNGVALLASVAWDYLEAWNSYFALWNPATREFKVVRPHRPRSQRKRRADVLALGFDKMSNDFKIIRSIDYKDEVGDSLGVCEYEMYSLNNDTWKSIKDPHPHIKIVERLYACDGYFNGAYYWSCQRRGTDQSYLILSFDFSNEVLKVHDPPVAPEGYEYYFISKYMDSLALFYKGYIDEVFFMSFAIFVTSSLDVDYQGISSSWSHLFTIGPFSPIEPLSFHLFRMDSDMLFATTDKSGYRMDGVLYNPSTGTFTRRFGLDIRRCREYVESLFRLSKGLIGS